MKLSQIHQIIKKHGIPHWFSGPQGNLPPKKTKNYQVFVISGGNIL